MTTTTTARLSLWRVLVVVAGLEIRERADQRQQAHLEAVGEQAVVEQALLDLVDVGVGDAAEEGGAGHALGGDLGAFEGAEGGELPVGRVPDLELFRDEIGKVVRLAQSAGLEALALEEGLGRGEAADAGHPRLGLVEISVEPLAQAGIILRVELRGGLEDDRAAVRPVDGGREDLIGINLDQQAVPGVALVENHGEMTLGKTIQGAGPASRCPPQQRDRMGGGDKRRTEEGKG
jgi:hypothetical protein